MACGSGSRRLSPSPLKLVSKLQPKLPSPAIKLTQKPAAMLAEERWLARALGRRGTHTAACPLPTKAGARSRSPSAGELDGVLARADRRAVIAGEYSIGAQERGRGAQR